MVFITITTLQIKYNYWVWLQHCTGQEQSEISPSQILPWDSRLHQLSTITLMKEQLVENLSTVLFHFNCCVWNFKCILQWIQHFSIDHYLTSLCSNSCNKKSQCWLIMKVRQSLHKNLTQKSAFWTFNGIIAVFTHFLSLMFCWHHK